MIKKILIALPITIGWFFIMEFIAPGHWGYFTVYFSATFESLYNNFSGLWK